MNTKLVSFGIILLLLFAGCVQESDEIRKLQDVEIQEYQGEDLSSIGDFRENSIKGPQNIDKSSYMLVVDGLVQNPRNYSYEEIVGPFQSYQKVVTLDCVEGWSAKILWEGVLFRDILDEVRPKPEAKVVILRAYDGYSTSFPIEYFDENDIIMAYKLNNVTLPPERGYPFQLIAESKWGYKWIKWITRIELSDNESYQGYWEQRGYSDTGNLNGSIFD
jgi:DMSO/TMAO reductase YedYZ molybdopterin-dependent catalytic subunit